jgi:hypothetical protein
MIYFNNSGRPAQHDGTIQIVAVDLKADFKMEDVYWENQFIYQYTSNREILPLPDLSLYSNLYYYKAFRKWSFQAGVDIRYFTAFYANEFNPYTGIFHTQNSTKIGNYPELGVYTAFEVEGVKIFASCNNWNNGLFGGKYYAMLRAHDTNSRLSVGIKWDLNI